jgi:hypothetical protein
MPQAKTKLSKSPPHFRYATRRVSRLLNPFYCLSNRVFYLSIRPSDLAPRLRIPLDSIADTERENNICLICNEEYVSSIYPVDKEHCVALTQDGILFPAQILSQLNDGAPIPLKILTQAKAKEPSSNAIPELLELLSSSVRGFDVFVPCIDSLPSIRNVSVPP